MCLQSICRGKGDAPDRFWAIVEPYCADITEADVRLLQEDIKSVRKMPTKMSVYGIPIEDTVLTTKL